MDGTPKRSCRFWKLQDPKGKGCLGMKIFGCGGLIKEEERTASLKYVVQSKKVHAMTIGFGKMPLKFMML